MSKEKLFVQFHKDLWFWVASSGSAPLKWEKLSEKASEAFGSNATITNSVEFLCKGVRNYIEKKIGEKVTFEHLLENPQICKEHCPYTFAKELPCGEKDSMYRESEFPYRREPVLTAENVNNYKKLANSIANIKIDETRMDDFEVGSIFMQFHRELWFRVAKSGVSAPLEWEKLQEKALEAFGSNATITNSMEFLCKGVRDYIEKKIDEEVTFEHLLENPQICKEHCPYTFARELPCGEKDSMYRESEFPYRRKPVMTAESFNNYKKLANSIANIKIDKTRMDDFEVVK